jgi:tRNA-dihydrouridine synthase B
LLRRPELAVALARAAGAGSGRPVTVKLRSGLELGDRSGLDLAVRLVEEAGVVAIALHPRSAAVQHRGSPDYELVADLGRRLAGSNAAVIVSGGLDTAAAARRVHEDSGADAVMIARGALGNPWIFEELTSRRASPPDRSEVLDELLWTMDRAVEHLGSERAARYLRKFYPWYLERLGVHGPDADMFQRAQSLDRARELLAGLPAPLAVAA